MVPGAFRDTFSATRQAAVFDSGNASTLFGDRSRSLFKVPGTVALRVYNGRGAGLPLARSAAPMSVEY